MILTNPPFGANVEPSDEVTETEVAVTDEDRNRFVARFGKLYEAAQAKVEAQKGKPIAGLFDLPKSEKSKIKTEILFIERCLSLLAPGGRLGIVLPEGVFNNSSLLYVAESPAPVVPEPSPKLFFGARTDELRMISVFPVPGSPR